MNKPVKEAKYAWDFNDVIDYVEDKYKIQTRGYKRSGPDDEYRDYWHWLLDKTWSDLNNGTYNHLPVKEILDRDKWLNPPDWVVEITQLIFDEFKEDEMEFFVCW